MHNPQAAEPDPEAALQPPEQASVGEHVGEIVGRGVGTPSSAQRASEQRVSRLPVIAGGHRLGHGTESREETPRAVR